MVDPLLKYVLVLVLVYQNNTRKYTCFNIYCSYTTILIHKIGIYIQKSSKKELPTCILMIHVKQLSYSLLLRRHLNKQAHSWEQVYYITYSLLLKCHLLTKLKPLVILET